jgi:UDP-glucuronate decarboxylase
MVKTTENTPVIDLTGSRSRIVYRPLPADDPKQRRPDFTRARATLGWSPMIALEAGLRETILYFEGLLSEGLMSLSLPGTMPAAARGV